MSRKLYYILFILTFSSGLVNGQTSISLDSCYQWATRNYPIVKQQPLMLQQHELALENIDKRYLPQLNLEAKASYQSEVTFVPVETPGLDIPRPNKDQYRATVFVNQLIYDGGATKNMNALQEAQFRLQQSQIDVTLHQVKERVNGLFFALLKIEANQELLKKLEDNLLSRKSELASAVKNGAALSINIDLIDIELLKIEQQKLELASQKEITLQSLAYFTGTEFSLEQKFNIPDYSNPKASTGFNRPELAMMQFQKQQWEASAALISNKNTPQLFAYGQGGLGNPGLNLLDNTFQPFYMVGLRLNWNITDWGKSKNEKHMYLLNQQIVDTQIELFEFNERMRLLSLNEDISEQQNNLVNQERIINLQQNVVNNYEVQYNNGALKYGDYLDEFTALNEAEIKLQTEKIELQRLITTYDLVLGNYSINEQ